MKIGRENTIMFQIIFLNTRILYNNKKCKKILFTIKIRNAKIYAYESNQINIKLHAAFFFL